MKWDVVENSTGRLGQGDWRDWAVTGWGTANDTRCRLDNAGVKPPDRRDGLPSRPLYRSPKGIAGVTCRSFSGGQ